MVSEGKFVKVHYTGTLADGEQFDSSEGREPLAFQVGGGQVIPGFDKAVADMKVGEKKTVEIKSEDAYGPRRDELVQTIPRENAPDNVEEGQQVVMSAPNGMRIPAKIEKLTDDEVTIDMNHPLAGKDLTFELELVEEMDQPPEGEGCGCGDGCGCK